VPRLSLHFQRIRAPVLGALVVLLAPLLGGCGGGSAAPPDVVAKSRTAPLESIFQADNQLLTDPAGTLEELHRLGVERIRVFVPWGALGTRTPIAPDALSHRAPVNFDATDPGAYPAASWAPYDAIVREATARGIGVYFTVAGPAPVWATEPGEPPGTASAPSPIGVWKPSASDFGEFMRAVGTRYSGHYPDPLHPGRDLPRVSFWGIWNEPNLGIDIAPQAIDSGKLEVSPVYYRQIVDAAWTALQATGHGHDTILIGELAPDGATVGPVPGDFDMMAPLRFLRALYCVDSSYHPLRGLAASQRGCPTTAAASAHFVAEHPELFHATGVADHPYSQGLAPNQAPPLEPDYAEFADVPNLEKAVDRLQEAYGSGTRFPIYSTEFGEQTNPPETLIRALAPPTAAYYMNWAEYLSWLNPRIRSYDQYLLVDAPNGTFSTALEFASGVPKATYAAYRMPLYLPATTAGHGQKLEVWGCVRPAHYAQLSTGRAQQVEIQFAPASGGHFSTVHVVPLTGPGCYFDVVERFPGSGTVRLRWSYPHGPAIYSRNVRITLH
jgi:hypothetical protein